MITPYASGCLQMTPISVSPPVPGNLRAPETEADRARVREQLERLLTAHQFRNSKRYPALLKFLVERVLNGCTDSIKERTLGIEVFRREPDYDTNQDPVVRTTMVEVRRRLSQYYQEPGREQEIRIEFRAGCYTPDIWIPVAAGPVLVPSPEPLPVLVPAPKRATPLVAAAAVAAIAALVVATTFWWNHAVPNSLELFWSPVWSSPDPVLICLEGDEAPAGLGLQASAGAWAPAQMEPFGGVQRVTLDYVTAVAGILGQSPHRTKFRIRSAANTKFEDLRESPIVLLGGFRNRWTMRVLDQFRLRYRFHRTGDLVWIGDEANPKQKWVVDFRPEAPPPETDFALITRFKDPSTGRIAVIAAGLTHFGTSAASEAICDPAYLEEVVRTAPAGWRDKNIQIVVSTALSGANSGPPRVLATYFW